MDQSTKDQIVHNHEMVLAAYHMVIGLFILAVVKGLKMTFQIGSPISSMIQIVVWISGVLYYANQVHAIKDDLRQYVRGDIPECFNEEAETFLQHKNFNYPWQQAKRGIVTLYTGFLIPELKLRNQQYEYIEQQYGLEPDRSILKWIYGLLIVCILF